MAGHGGAEVEQVLGSMQTSFTAVTVGSKGCGAEDAELWYNEEKTQGIVENYGAYQVEGKPWTQGVDV